MGGKGGGEGKVMVRGEERAGKLFLFNDLLVVSSKT